MSPTTAMSPIAVYREWQRCLAANDFEGTNKVVDMDGYTEICLGLTSWTTGYQVAYANYYRNMIAPWKDLAFKEEDIVESSEGVTVRLHVEGTQLGEFLGIPPTGRRASWDHVSIVKVKAGRVTGQWAQPDLWGIYQQLTGRA
jgi:predicted ester cyclase